MISQDKKIWFLPAGLLLAVLVILPEITGYSVTALVRQWALMSCLVLGLLFELLSGPVELSFAAQIGSGAALFAFLLKYIGLGPAFLGTMVFCVGLGALKGWMFARFPVHPLITSIGLKLLISGITDSVLGIVYLDNSAFYRLSRPFLWWIMFAAVWVLAGGAAWLLQHTYLGRCSFLVGGNRKEMERCGVPCTSIIIAMHSLAGVFFALAALQLVFASNSGSVSGADTMLYQGIMAACLGGISLLGGKGSAEGALTGALAVVLLQLLMTYLGIASRYENLIQGLIILSSLWGSSVGIQRNVKNA